MTTNPLCFKCKKICEVSMCTQKGNNYQRRFWVCPQSETRGGVCSIWNGWIDRPKNKLSDKALENISGLLTAYDPLKKLCEKELGLGTK